MLTAPSVGLLVGVQARARVDVVAVAEAEPARRRLDVLVAAAGEVDQQQRVRAQLPAQHQRTGQRVRRLDRRDDALGAAEQREGLHRLGVGDRAVLGAADVVQVGVLRADAGVVQAGADRVRLDGLAVVVLQQVGAGAVQHARASRR